MSRRRTSRSVGRRLTAVVVVAVAAAVVPLGAWVPSAQAATTGLALTGHGWGAGVGMGQWGAFGDAVDGMPYTAILSHFYGGTSLQTLTAAQDATEVRVAMVENDGSSAIVTSASPFTVAGVSVAAGQAAMLQPLPGDVWDVYVSGSCAGGSSGWGAPVVSNVTDPTAVPSSDPPLGDPSAPDLVLQLCEPSGTLPVRGDIEGVFNANNDARTVNILPLEQYVASVVPNESYAYWGSLGGPGPQGQDWGFQALEAQAVAARSFVMAGLGSYGGYADVCDIGCQSYRGLDNASPLTDLATTDTAGEVLELANGSIASTQYSASTGGYTAPSAFPAVPDAGDAVCLPQACNPNHTWSVTVPASSIEAAWPQIGTFVAIDITARNGLGDWGGRVTQLTVEGTTGSVQVSGDTFAGTLGLRSDWFTPTLVLAKPAVGMAATSDGGGYHLVASDGGIFSFGNAHFYGSMGGHPLNKPIVAMAATPNGGGYWEVASDGGIFSFGDAQFYGSMGGHPLNKPVVGMAAVPGGGGYWEVASDGGIFSFGDAQFYGSMGGQPLNAPIVGMAAVPGGGGYWEVASDGGIFSFGDAQFYGSTGGTVLDQTVVGMAAVPGGGGYWLVGSAGGVYAFGDAGNDGSASS